MNLDVRQAELIDAEEISALVNGAYRGETGAQGWTTEASLLGGMRTDVERVEALIQASGSVVLVAETANPAGSILEACVHLEKKNATTAYLGMLTTDSSRQARGTGRYMLEKAEEFVRDQWGMSEIEMTVITLRTELIEWYVRRGYSVTNEKRPFPSDPRFGIPLVNSPLEFLVLKKSL